LVEQDVRGAPEPSSLLTMQMDGGTGLTLGLVVGGFLLAVWVDARIGESRPESPGRRVGHVVVGFLALEASVGVLYLVDSLDIPQVAFMGVVLAVFLPALTYSLLTAMWLVRTLVEIARLARR
jgi:hypothetical protein